MLHFISSFLALITHVWKDECGIRGLVDSFCSNRELQAMERLEEACGTASDREIGGGLGYCRRPGILQEAWGTASNRELGGGLGYCKQQRAWRRPGRKQQRVWRSPGKQQRAWRSPGVLQVIESLEEAWCTASNRELGRGLGNCKQQRAWGTASNRELGVLQVIESLVEAYGATSDRKLGGGLGYSE